MAIGHSSHHTSAELCFATVEVSVNILTLFKHMTQKPHLQLVCCLNPGLWLYRCYNYTWCNCIYAPVWPQLACWQYTCQEKFAVSTNVDCFCCVVLCFPLLWVLRTLHYVRATFIAMCTCVAVFPGGSKHTFLVFILFISFCQLTFCFACCLLGLL